MTYQVAKYGFITKLLCHCFQGPIVEVSVLAENSISSDSITRLGLALERPCDRPRVYVGEEGSSPVSFSSHLLVILQVE